MFRLIFLISSVSANCGECVIPKLITFESKGYSFETIKKMNFFEAYEYCRYKGMYLYTPEKISELLFLNNTMNKSVYETEDFWTSAYCVHNKTHPAVKSCSYLSTGLPVLKIISDRIPKTDKPNRFCIHLTAQTRHGFEYTDCDVKNYFICEMLDC